MVDYTRKITHSNYKNSEKLKKYYHRVVKKIYSEPNKFDKNYTNTKFSDFLFFNNEILVSKSGNWIVPIIAGGISMITALGLFFFSMDEQIKEEDWAVIIICSVITLFFLVYSITMPKKENILNRKKELITFPGFMWQPNITMNFNTVEFAYSTGAENGVGAFQLEIIRPNKWQTFAIAGYIGSECYSNMSFITWYMDKNRPLPPGEVFDEYRQQDYERRKAAGFPRPLYPSAIETPEFTKEQQAERKKIGGW